MKENKKGKERGENGKNSFKKQKLTCIKCQKHLQECFEKTGAITSTQLQPNNEEKNFNLLTRELVKKRGKFEDLYPEHGGPFVVKLHGHFPFFLM